MKLKDALHIYCFNGWAKESSPSSSQHTCITGMNSSGLVPSSSLCSSQADGSELLSPLYCWHIVGRIMAPQELETYTPSLLSAFICLTSSLTLDSPSGLLVVVPSTAERTFAPAKPPGRQLPSYLL